MSAIQKIKETEKKIPESNKLGIKVDIADFIRMSYFMKNSKSIKKWLQIEKNMLRLKWNKIMISLLTPN